ncbi:MAG: hypothetical protein R2750_06970 [Bacteroidales bacterium]
MKTAEKILVVFMLLLLILPAIQKEFSLFRVKSLNGDFEYVEKPSFSWNTWFDGSFQSAFDTWLEENIGFRNAFIRITNQVDYSLFTIPHAEGVVICKEKQLIEFDYIRAYDGGDFLGEATIDKRIRKLKFVQKHLKTAYDIDFVLVFEPGKASFYPEFIPDKYLTRDNPKTNYDYFVKSAKEYDVRFIDFNAWFKKMKGTTSYPLYPRYGTHWSEYGMSFAADSLVNYLEFIRQIDMNDVFIDSLEVQVHARKPDYDMGAALNLLFRLPESDSLAYPVWRFENNPDKPKPMVLTIADSYYWNIYNTGIPHHLFANQSFWYFGNLVYPEYWKNPTFATNLNLKEEVEKQDIILMMITERFLHKFDFALVDNLYKIYAPQSIYDKVYQYKSEIWIFTEWIDKVIEKAEKRKVPFSEVLDKEAKYVYHMKEPENYMTFRGQEHYEESIRADDHWLNLVDEKAKERGISLDEMIHLESDYMFKTNYPDAYARYIKLNEFKNSIRNDSSWLSHVQDKANTYYLSLEEMLQIEAEYLLTTSGSQN